MKNYLQLLGCLGLLLCSQLLWGQQIDFTLKYNLANNEYEVYGKSDFSDPAFFVGGGSQISVVLPASVNNAPLAITNVNGGPWFDNSQIYSPAADAVHDFHGIASNGSLMAWVSGEETLLFKFTFVGATCLPGIRLFENASDPQDTDPGMAGGDFNNYFADAFTFTNIYNANYDNVGTSCDPPLILPNPLTIPQDSTGNICLPVLDLTPNDTFSVTICGVENGTVNETISGANVCLEYTPNAGFSGTDSICVIVCDKSGFCDTTAVPVTVVPPLPPTTNPEPPTVIPTPITVPEDSTAMVCTPILDPNSGDTFTATVCTGSPANGTATPTIVGNTLCVAYTPTAGYTGDDPICIIVCDQTNLCDTVTIPVSIIPTPAPPDSMQPPIIVLPPVVTPEDSTTTICGPVVDANPGDTHTVTICDQPANGTATASIDNTSGQVCLTIDPNPNFIGTDSVCVLVCDQTGLCDSVIVPIVITSTNTPPIAIDDINSTLVDSPISGSVITNDSDPENDNLSVNTTPFNEMNGTVVIDAAGDYTFTPSTGFIGEASFQYLVCDDGSPSLCDTATVIIEILDNINPDSNTINGVTDNFVTENDNPLTGDLLANDSDPEGDNLTINTTPVTPPTTGILVINPDGTFSFTPDPLFEGIATFEYQVCDDGTPMACDTVAVTIEILPGDGMNDIYATDDANTGAQNEMQTGNITNNDNDPENNNVTVTLIDSTANGALTLNPDGTYIYIPNMDYKGSDAFVYRICDDGSPVACDSATVYLTILETLVPPIVIPNPLTIPADSTGTICMPITDINVGDTFTANVCPGSPTNGTATPTVVGNTLCVEYTPTAGFNGTDEVCLIICDQTGLCDTVTIPVTVVEPLPPSVTPEPPVVVPTPLTTLEDSIATVCMPILDPNVGDTFTATICTGSPANGTATPTIVGNTLCVEYTPNMGYTGDDPVCVIVCDQGGLCDTITVPVYVVPIPEPTDSLQPPIVVLPPVVTTVDSTITVCGLAVDPNTNDTLSAMICEQPANGTASVTVDNNTGQVCLMVDPNTGFEGTDSVCVIICDQTGLCDSVKVPIVIYSTNTPPFAIDDINSTTVNMPITGTVTTNDSDPENDNLTVNTTPLNEMNGTVVIDAMGNYTFTPDPDFVGEATFQYEVCDDGAPSLCDTAMVTIEVLANINPDSNTVMGVTDNFVTENDNPLAGDLLANDSDPEGDNLTINTTPVTPPTTGTLVINTDGTFTFTPDPSFVGVETFDYQVCDDGTPMACDTVAVTIEVLPGDGMNDIYATDDANSGGQNEMQIGNVADNDNDPESDNVTVTLIDSTTNGNLVLNTDGTYTYTPNTDYLGNDVFVYMICDDGSPIACDSATVYLTILAKLAPPIVIPNPLTILQDSTGTICMPITDVNAGDTFTATLCTGSPMNGTATPTVVGNTLCLTYTPTTGYSGTDEVCIIVCDQTGLCDTTMIAVTVVPSLPPTTTPEPPMVVPSPLTTMEDSMATVCMPILDPNVGDTFTATVCTGSPANGTATPTIVGNTLCLAYTPNTGYTGDDPVCVIVCDQGGLCDTITVPVYVIPLPEPTDSLQPPVVILPPVVTPVDSTITVCGITVDPNVNDTLSVTICEQPANGTASVTVDNNTGQICLTFDPNAGFEGTDSVCVLVCDQTGLCDSVKVPIVIISTQRILNLKVMLQGAMFFTNDGLMRDDLREQSLIPLQQPYSSNLATRFTHIGGGGTETTTTAVLNSNGDTPDVIVDWVFIEFRDGTDATNIVQTMSALVQRDGDVVDAATGQPLVVNSLPTASAYISVKHRNHLGAMTAQPVSFNGGPVTVDFTTMVDADLYNQAGYDDLEMATISGKRALWAGNANADTKVKYDGIFNDRIVISSEVWQHPDNAFSALNFNLAIGYYQGDVSMDGKTKYDGVFNDRVLIQNNVLLYPLNTQLLNNFNQMVEQLPTN